MNLRFDGSFLDFDGSFLGVAELVDDLAVSDVDTAVPVVTGVGSGMDARVGGK